MIWRLEWTDRALRDAERLDRRTRERILAALERLAATNYGDVERLHGRDREWRLRMGQWRVRLIFDAESGTIVILRVLPRGRAYRR